ncbi:MAG: DUF3500 domain-containing protein [Verrucomicrobiota bacterium]
MPTGSQAATADEMAAAATDFLNSLSEEQKAKAQFELKIDERKNWHYVPKTNKRKGLVMNELKIHQSHLAHALLMTGMSHKGYGKAMAVMSLEQVLHELENNAPHRDPSLYYFSIFGNPGSDKTWGWRCEGHHLSLNFTVAGEKVSMTPSFFASNPARIPSGPRKGLRVLAGEEDIARDLVKSFSDDEKKVVIFSEEAPKEILTGAERKVDLLKPLGMPYEKMGKKQQRKLLRLIREYLFRHRPPVAKEEFDQIKEKELGDLHFAWGGGLEMGEGHYYRVQGKTFLLEYANTQNDAYHVHSVWRSLGNDFGEDILKKHYEAHP